MGARQCKRPLVEQATTTTTCLHVPACPASSFSWLSDSSEDRGMHGSKGAAAAARAGDGSRGPKRRRTSAAHPPPALLRAGPRADKVRPAAGQSLAATGSRWLLRRAPADLHPLHAALSQDEPGSWPSEARACGDSLFVSHAAAAAAGGVSHRSTSIDDDDDGDSTCFGAEEPAASQGLLQFDGHCGCGGGSSLGRGGGHPGAAAGCSSDDEWAGRYALASERESEHSRGLVSMVPASCS